MSEPQQINRLLEEVQRRLKVNFSDPSLLLQAFSHGSYVHETSEKGQVLDYNRMEFLGDAVLGLIISHYLYESLPDKPAGYLTKVKGKVVSQPFLAKVAKQWDLGSFVLLGKGEEETGGRKRESILAASLEALLGALYLDQGFEASKEFLLRLFQKEMENLCPQELSGVDYKSLLQESTQAFLKTTPTYEVSKEYGPAHEKTYEVVVKVMDTSYGHGKGKSKKEAEQKAAQQALEKVQQLWTTSSLTSKSK